MAHMATIPPVVDDLPSTSHIVHRDRIAGALRLVPLSRSEANRWIGKHHRHNRAVVGDIFRVGLADSDGNLVGVGIAGRPPARMLDDGYTIEITRVCTDGTDNACSMLYGALCRAAKALGYRRAITYTLQSEPGASLKAANFTAVAELPARGGWSCPSKPRPVDLWGNEAAPAAAKIRWERQI